LFALVCLDCCHYPIKETCEAGGIDFRSVFSDILRQNMLAEILRRISLSQENLPILFRLA